MQKEINLGDQRLNRYSSSLVKNESVENKIITERSIYNKSVVERPPSQSRLSKLLEGTSNSSS